MVLLAVDSAYCIRLSVDIRNYGNNSDGGTFAGSPPGKELKTTQHAPEYSPFPYSIAEDEVFPL